MRPYSWNEPWPRGDTSDEWSHSGIAVRGDTVLFAAPGGSSLVVLDVTTSSSTEVPTPLLELHGISVDTEEPDSVWLADPGEKPRPELDYAPVVQPGQVIKLPLSGGAPTVIEQPTLPEYRSRSWRPTSVVSDGHGGVWVADGYGSSLIHKFSRSGDLLLTLGGDESGLSFDCPHGLVIDNRGPRPLVIIADRGNCRLVSFDLTGELVSINSDPIFTSPSSLAIYGDDLYVTELYGAVLAIDSAGTARSLVESHAASARPEPWPNEMRDGRLVRPTLVPGRVNSPHGIAVGADGTVFLTEWVIGGRIIALRPTGPIA